MSKTTEPKTHTKTERRYVERRKSDGKFLCDFHPAGTSYTDSVLGAYLFVEGERVSYNETALVPVTVTTTITLED